MAGWPSWLPKCQAEKVDQRFHSEGFSKESGWLAGLRPCLPECLALDAAEKVKGFPKGSGWNRKKLVNVFI